MRKPIALVGLPASGKSSVGQALAALLGLAFHDLDEVIEAEAGKTIPEIFQSLGEAGFRALESMALSRLAGAGPSVLATGGGCVLSAGNRAILAERCLTVWLDVDPALAAARALRQEPPLARPLIDGDALARMLALDAERRLLYRDCARIEIRVGAEGIEAVAARVGKALSDRQD